MRNISSDSTIQAYKVTYIFIFQDICRRKKEKKWLKTAYFWVQIVMDKGEKGVQNRLEKKENELIGFLKREFNIGYHVVEAK